MIVMAYTDKARSRLMDLKMTVIYSDAYAWAKLIAGKMGRIIRADEFYALAEECIIEQTPKMPRCIRGRGPNYLYNKIPELAEVCFAENQDFVTEIKRIATLKNEQVAETLKTEPKIRAICA